MPEQPQAILDIDELQHFPLHRQPFQWGATHGLMRMEDALALEADFPSEGYIVNERLHGSDKTYRIAINTLLAPGDSETKAGVTLSPHWQRIVDELRSDRYRQTMSALSGINLDDALLEIVLNQYDRAYWLAPHTDKFPKLVTQLFYFGDHWDARWGGNLQILLSEQPDSVIYEVTPCTGASTIIVRSDNSWHAVTPVEAQAPTQRKSLQITFWAAEPLKPPPGRRHLDEEGYR